MRNLQRQFEAAAEEFESELLMEHYLVGSGRKPTLQEAAVYERHAWLFEPATVGGLQELPPDRQVQHLVEFAVLGNLQNSVRGISEEIINHELSATVTWDGEEVPFRQAAVLLWNEPDVSRRRDLERRINNVTAQANPRRQVRLATVHQAAAALGYSDFVAMCDQLRGLHLDAVRREMERFIELTEGLFEREQEERFQCEKITLAEATTADAARVMRGASFDRYFPADRLVPALRTTLRGLGLDLDRQPHLLLDVEPRPLKSPRAFCSSIRVPDDVRLVVAPHGGVDDYRALLHEAGHAEHALGTDRKEPFAFRRLGDNSVTEMYAFLLDNLAHNARWLRDTLGVADDNCRRLSLFYKLRLLRRYGAKLAYEMDLHRTEGESSMADRYVATLGRALRVRVAGQNYLSDVDDAFYCAQYLRAWLAEVRLRAYLEREYGEGWFATRSAGDVLRELWMHGQAHPVEEILQMCGGATMSAGPLIAESMLLTQRQ